MPPRPTSRYAVKEYYETNKAEILRDLAELGESQVRQRWGISQATWICHRKTGQLAGLAVRWGVETEATLPTPRTRGSKGNGAPTISEGKPGDDWKTMRPLGPLTDTRTKSEKEADAGSLDKLRIPAPTQRQRPGNDLPPFPPFNGAWTEPVQVEWFRTYVALALRRRYY